MHGIKYISWNKIQVRGIKINSQKTCKICSFKFYIHLHKNLAYRFVTHIFPTFDSPHVIFRSFLYPWGVCTEKTSKNRIESRKIIHIFYAFLIPKSWSLKRRLNIRNTTAALIFTISYCHTRSLPYNYKGI